MASSTRKPGEGTLAYASRMLEQQRKAPLKLKNPKIIMDPPQLAALRREIQYHPELVKKLGNQMDDLPTTIGVIAGYLEIAMEGEYSFQDLMGACELITRKLYESRTSIVLTGKKGV